MPSKLIAYIAWIPPAGIFGAHHLYLGRYRWTLAYTITFGLFGLGWISDLFRISSLCDQQDNHNTLPENDNDVNNIDNFISHNENQPGLLSTIAEGNDGINESSQDNTKSKSSTTKYNKNNIGEGSSSSNDDNNNNRSNINTIQIRRIIDPNSPVGQAVINIESTEERERARVYQEQLQIQQLHQQALKSATERIEKQQIKCGNNNSSNTTEDITSPSSTVSNVDSNSATKTIEEQEFNNDSNDIINDNINVNNNLLNNDINNNIATAEIERMVDAALDTKICSKCLQPKTKQGFSRSQFKKGEGKCVVCMTQTDKMN